MARSPGAIAIAKDGVLLRIRVTPRAARDEVTGIENRAQHAMINARVRAAPADHAANQALEALISRWLEVPKSSVEISAGPKSRIKTIAVLGEPGALERRVRRKLAELDGAANEETAS